MTLAAALGGALIISFSAIFFGLSEASPVTGAFYRAAYAAPLLLALWWARRGEDRRSNVRRWFAFGAGIALGFDVMAWHSSIDLIGAGLATLIANSQVIFVAIAAWILQRERPSPVTLIAIPVVLVGIGLVSGVGQSNAFGENPLLGAALALLAAVFYSMFLLGFRHSNEEKAPSAGPLFEATAGALVASLAIGLVGSGIDFGFTWPGHGWLLALAIGAQVVGWLGVGYALPRLPAVETSTIILIQPALTLLWAVLIFSERPSVLQIVGAAVILGGVGLVVVTRARMQPSAARSLGPFPR